MFCGLAPVHLPRKTSWLVTCLISVFYQADMNCHIFTEYLCIDMQGNMSYKYCIVMGFYSRESIGFWPAPKLWCTLQLSLQGGLCLQLDQHLEQFCSGWLRYQTFSTEFTGYTILQRGLIFLSSQLDVVILIWWCVWIARGCKGYRSLQKTRQALVCCTFVGLIRFKMRVCVRSASQSLDHQCV